MGRGICAVASVLLLVSCNETGVGSFKEPEPIVRRIEVRPQVLDFGAVAPGESATRRFTVRNVGNGNVDVGVSSMPAELGFSFDEPQQRLQPGEEREFTVHYLSNGFEKREPLPLEQDSDTRDVAVTLVTREALGQLIITPNPLDFGTAGFGNPVDREALLENAGNAPLLVHDLSVVGKAFYLDDHPDLPLQLGPGETAPVQLTFDPLMEKGSEEGVLWAEVTGTRDTSGPVPLVGESILGGIKGRICDPSEGGWVAGATVVASVDTNGDHVVDATRTTTTDGDGYYVIEDLPRSTVDIQATKGRLKAELTVDVTGGGVHELPDPTCLDQGDLRIAVIPGGFDDTGALLDGIGLEWSEEDASLLQSASRMAQYDLIFGGCAAVNSSIYDDRLVERYIENGGALYVSDLSTSGSASLFDHVWAPSSGGLYGTVLAFPQDAAMLTRVPSSLSIAYEAVIGLEVDAKKDPSITATELLLVDLGMGRGKEPAIVRLDVGDGSLVLSTFHTSRATSPDLLAIFEEVVWGM